MTNSRITCRGGKRCEAATFREALHCQTTHSAMELEAIADRLGMHEHTLAKMVNPNAAVGEISPTGKWSALPTRHLPTLLQLTTDNHAVASYLARLQNGTFVPNLVIAGDTDQALFTASGAVIKELSEAVDVVREKFRSGNRITADELPEIDREIDDIVRAALQFRSAVHALAALPASPAPTQPRPARRTRR